MAKQREVCKYYLQDRCHYGANCRFLHPPKNQHQFGYGHSSNSGRFDNGRNWGDRPIGRGGNPYVHVQQQNYRGRGGGGGGRGGGWSQRGGGGGGGDGWSRGGGGDGWSQRGGGGGWSQSSENWSSGNSWRGGGRGGGGNWHSHDNWRGRGRGNWSGTSNRRGSGANWFSDNDGRGGGGWSNTRTGGNLKSTSWIDGPSTRQERRVSWEDETNMVTEETSTEPTATQIVASIKEDLSNWEKGTMWPLSCYSPAPSGVCPNLTNMEDHSMEEIRYLAYEAQANGTSQQYIDNVRKEYEKQQRLFQQYQSTTTDEIIHFVTGSRPYTTPASVRTGSHSSLATAGTNGLVTPVKDLFGVKETKQNSINPSDSTTTQQISDTDLQAFQANKFVGGAIPETPPPINLC